ncbi:MAG: DUF1559 domain-containing protein [Planctomycetales bacterium]
MITSLPATLVWCVLQVTLLTGVVLLWYGMLRRSGPAARSLAAFTGLVMIVPVTVLAFSPWPAWTIASWFPTDSDTSPSSVAADATLQGESEQESDDANKTHQLNSHTPSFTTMFFQSLAQELQTPSETGAKAPRWNWPTLLAMAVLLGVVCGLARLLAGILLVRNYRSGSRPVTDDSLLELRDVLQAELSCPRPIELLESPVLTTAATMGWRRPRIILPANWRDWTDGERRAVLAHEISHIQRHDFPTWVAAQLALVLHFYHPLVHWLCGRLRLEQELAADAAAARLAGGQQAYLTTLAAMALRQADRPVAWPARTFLPTRGTFMRRIEMLRDKKLLATTTPMGVRIVTVGVLLLASLAIAGLKGLNGPLNAAAADPLTTAVGSALGASDESAGLEYVPRDAVLVATLRPAALLARPEMAPLSQALQQQGGMREQLGIAADKVEQVTVVMLAKEIQGGVTIPDLAGLIVRGVAAADVQALVQKTMPQYMEQEFAGRKFFKNAGGGGGCYFFIDDKTVVVAEEEAGLRRMIVAGSGGASKAKWAAAWREVSTMPGALLLNTEAIRSSLALELQRQTQQGGPGVAMLSTIAPLWQNADTVTLGMKLDSTLNVSGKLISGNADDAKKVSDTLSAVMTLVKNALSQGRGAAARAPGNEAATLLALADAADSLLDNVKIVQKDREVQVNAAADSKDLVTLVSAMLPAVSAARDAARRTQSMNNLKQIGLAMHNYADVNKSFPPAVLYGPDGKTPYSWRVALLPYLEQDALFRQYNFNEPWDSANNKQILAKMPPQLRDPNEPATSTNASYFALTGPDTVFSGKDGTGFAKILDGTSNTLMIVEAQRDIPWTKPEDIPYAADKNLPKLGGHYPEGFLALFCDGAVRFIAKALDEKTLRTLITKAGGEAIPNF